MTANTKQIGGNHYSKLAIQPMEYALKNGLNYAQANAIKYITRYKDKNGIEDLHKAIHCIELLIQHETEHAAPEWPSEDRIDAIGQNGPTAEHYRPELLAIPEDVVIPEWANWIGADARGMFYGYDHRPEKNRCTYDIEDPGDRIVALWYADKEQEMRLYKRTPEGFALVLDWPCTVALAYRTNGPA